jgi:hypothetical protein
MGLTVINVVFTVIHIFEEYGCKEAIMIIRKDGVMDFSWICSGNFFSILSDNIGDEVKQEKHPYMVVIFYIIFLYFTSGVPFFFNYYGIYGEYTVEDMGGRNRSHVFSDKKPYYLLSKNHDIKTVVRNLKNTYADDEPEYTIKKNRYLFFKAGLFDGFESDLPEYKGLIAYISCLFYAFVEKLIHAILSFLIPFIACIYLFKLINKFTK